MLCYFEQSTSEHLPPSPRNSAPMVQGLYTSCSFVSLIAFVSCALNLEMFSTSKVDESCGRFSDTKAVDLNSAEFTGSSLQTVDIAIQDATKKQNQRHFMEPVTSLLMPADRSLESLSGYLFQVFYADMECKGPAFSGFSVQLDTCIPNNNIYLFVTTTLLETTQTYYTDSKCTIVSSVRKTPFQSGCAMGFTNKVNPSFEFPSKVPHVGIR